jgi:predicted Rossmann fold nucleotide-binding protein DprA/Smf involved in DNA uptake
MTVPNSVAAMKMSARCINEKGRVVLNLEGQADSTASKSCTLSTKTGANLVDNIPGHWLELVWPHSFNQLPIN